ncbi:hypothetical protein F4V43_11600 [Paenibacillus spiritus]|uniref:Uncharacterized protein n=1 Tax=Paenibacillus spiritus TaxID=2496557 RepID=A0A5J5G8I6_9BACL|nr:MULTISPECIES: hypothetical protein [Paenibacillus]KAA9004046.1 hypothetical protein F4V43_11600 [Paenibacillus spiritus]
MRDIEAEGPGMNDPFFIMLEGRRIADAAIAPHAARRLEEWNQREGSPGRWSAFWLWQCLKQKRIRVHSPEEPEIYCIDNDLVIAVRLTEIAGETDKLGNVLYKLTVVSFLGKMSEDIHLRDLSALTARPRNAKRGSLVHTGRKRR